MTDLLVKISVGVLLIAMLLGFYRLARGPSVADRILAFDAIVLCAVALTAILSRWWASDLYLELILIVSSLGFFGTVAFVFILQHTLPDPEKPREPSKEATDA